MTLNEFSEQTFKKVINANSVSEVITIIEDAYNRLNENQFEVFSNHFNEKSIMLNESQSNDATLRNLALARKRIKEKIKERDKEK